MRNVSGLRLALAIVVAAVGPSAAGMIRGTGPFAALAWVASLLLAGAMAWTSYPFGVVRTAYLGGVAVLSLGITGSVVGNDLGNYSGMEWGVKLTGARLVAVLVSAVLLTTLGGFLVPGFVSLRRRMQGPKAGRP